MFHRYITAATGRQIDIDRASYLMDKTLWQPVKAASIARLGLSPFDFDCAKRNGMAAPRASEPVMLQAIWEEYCRAHFNKHGEDFVPNADPEWDS
jgi:hypothetical protein